MPLPPLGIRVASRMSSAPSKFPQHGAICRRKVFHNNPPGELTMDICWSLRNSCRKWVRNHQDFQKWWKGNVLMAVLVEMVTLVIMKRWFPWSFEVYIALQPSYWFGLPFEGCWAYSQGVFQVLASKKKGLLWHWYLLFKLLYSCILILVPISSCVERPGAWGLADAESQHVRKSCRVPSCSVAEHPQKIPRFWIKVSFEGACIRKWQWCHEMSVPSTTHWALSMYSINWQHFSSYFLHLLLVFQNISMLFEPSMKFERLSLKSLSASRALCRFTDITFSYLPVSGPRISGG